MTRGFDEAFERLKSNPDKVRAEVQEFHREMKTFLQEIRDDAEKDIPETPNVPINYMQFENNPTEELIALGIAYVVKEKGRTDLLQDLENLYPRRKKLSGNYLAKISSLVQEYVENRDFSKGWGGLFSHPDWDIGWKVRLSRDGGRVYVANIPKEIFPQISMPKLIEPLIRDQLILDFEFDKTTPSDNPESYLKALINHEYTHAYIYRGMGGRTSRNLETKSGSQFNTKNLDEGAAMAVSTVYYPADTIPIEFYREWSSNHSRTYLQFFKACFLAYADRYDSKPEKVYRIRKRAVEAIDRLDKHPLIDLGDWATRGKLKDLSIIKQFSITEAILGENNRELEKFADIVYHLERAEKLSFHGLVLLNILSPENAEEQIYELDNELESTFSESMNQLFPQEGFIEDGEDSGLLYSVGRKVENISDESKIRYEKTEFRDSILQIKQGIEQIENQLMENEDLKEEEKRLLQQLVEDLREAIEAYQEENKVERTYEEEWSQEFDAEVSEIAEWVKERVANGDYTDPVRVSRNMMLQLNSIVDDYFKIIEAGENYNRKILNALKNLHGDENQALKILERHRDKQEYREMNQMLQITEKIYELVENSQQNFESALDNLEKAQEELPEN